MLTRAVARNPLLTRAFSAAPEQASKFPAYILQAPATELSTTENGIRVASEGGHGDTATVGVWIDAGSRYETAENNGAAHFLEHMAFKGTNTRTRQQLEVEIENMGGHLNAYTSREQTVYYAKVFKNDVSKAVEILSDILQNSKLDERAIENERDVILREMEEVNKAHEEVIFDRLHETAFRTSGLGRTILGPAENIKSLTRQQLRDYIDTHYTTDRIVVAGAGAIDHQELVKLVDQNFGSFRKTPREGLTVPKDPAVFTGSDIRVREDAKLPVAHVAYTFEGAKWTSPHSFPLMVMQTLLGVWDRTSGSGSSMNSMLCRTVAEKGLAHSIMSFNTCYQDTGLLGVYAVAEDKNLNELSYEVMENMVRLCHTITADEVERAKTQLKSNLLMQLDGSSAVAEDIGRQLLTYGRRLTPAELFARIDAVDTSAVKATANEFINDKDIAVAAIGPIYELPDYNWLRRRTYWLRY